MGNQRSQHKPGFEVEAELRHKNVITSALSATYKKLDAATLKSNNTKSTCITKAVFKSYFSEHLTPSFSEVLCEYFQSHSDQDGDGIPEDLFVSRCQHIVELSDLTGFYFKLFLSGKTYMDSSDLDKVVRTAFTIDTGVIDIMDAGNAVMSAVVCGLLGGKTKIARAEFSNWVHLNAPRLLLGLHKRLSSELLDNSSSVAQPKQFADRHLLHLGVLWLLSVFLPSIFTSESESVPTEKEIKDYRLPEWYLIYDSNDQGLSMNRFEHHCFHYKGPTVMLVSLADSTLVAFVSDMEWRESTKRWGGVHTYAIQILPTYKIIEDGELFYLNLKTRGLPLGFQFGTDPRKPVMSINKEMQEAVYNQVPISLNRIEVWGCGTEEDKERQAKQREWESQQAEQERKVKLPGKWEDNPDKALLELAGIKTDHAERGDV